MKLKFLKPGFCLKLPLPPTFGGYPDLTTNTLALGRFNTKSIADFHRFSLAHAGRAKRPQLDYTAAAFFIIIGLLQIVLPFQ